MYYHPTPLPSTDDSATGRLLAQLADPDAVFTRDQVAWLMGTAQRWGYEAKADEVNGEYPPEPVLTFGRWSDQADARAKADAVARLPRVNDFQGGLPLPSEQNEEMAA